MHSVHAIQVNAVISIPEVKHTDYLGQHTDRPGIMEIFLDFFFVVRTKKAPKNVCSTKLTYAHPRK